MSLKDSIKIKRLKKGDINEFMDLIKVFAKVFEMEHFSMPDQKHLQSLLDRDNFDAFVVLKEDQIVGGLTTYILQQYYSIKPLAYLYDLAVDINYQRKGLGKQLIEEVNSFYKDQGFEELFVQAEKADDYAIDFYRKTKPSQEEQVVYFSYLLNE